MHKNDNVSWVCVLLHHFLIILADDCLSTPLKRNQTLKTGTPHENSPLDKQPHPYGAKKNAGN